jgi:hypothetical protein
MFARLAKRVGPNPAGSTIGEFEVKWVKVNGRVIYDPEREDIRKKSRATPWWLIVQLTGRDLEDFSGYYRWILRSRGIGMIQMPAWKPHVTILDGRIPVAEQYHHLWKKYNDLIVPFEYAVDIEKQWKFWVLPVRCEFFTTIRKELGFHNHYPYHITIGREYEVPEKG